MSPPRPDSAIVEHGRQKMTRVESRDNSGAVHRPFQVLARQAGLAALIGVGLTPGAGSAGYRGPVDRLEAGFSPDGDGLSMILNQLEAARASVDVAMFYLSNDVLVDALGFVARRRPVAVRVIVDEGMAQGEHRRTLGRLHRSGAAVFVEELPRAGKLHLKLALIDEETVVTGSSNWTEFAFQANCEDTLVLRSRPAAAAYQRRFDELLGQAKPWTGGGGDAGPLPDRFPEARRFGTREDLGLRAPPAETFRDLPRIEVYFTPSRGGADRLVDLIGSAEREVDVGIFYLSDQRIVHALCQAASASRTRVRVLTDDLMLGGARRDVLERLHACGAAVYYRKADAASMHLKTAVVDRRVVTTGSHNWTRSAAERNAEDMLFVHSPAMAAYYTAYLDHLVERYAVPWGVDEGGMAAAARARRRAALRRLALDADPFPESLPPTGPRRDFSQPALRIPETALTPQAAAAYVDNGAYLPLALDLIRTARQSILVSMHLVAAHGRAPAVHQLLEALAEAAERGVFVYVVLDTPAHPGDRRLALHSEAVERLRQRGVDARLSVPGAVLHEKLVVVDLAKALVGSHNWTPGALTGHTVEEASVLLVFPRQQHALAQRILRHPIVRDMRSRSAWEREISVLQRLLSLEDEARTQLLQQWEDRQ